MPGIGYVAYVDEAGDFGLRSVVPIDPTGGSEWFVLGAAVVRKENESEVPKWLRIIRNEAKNTQSMDLHFRGLSDRQKRVICSRLADLPIRLFVVISNKRNMRHHSNPKAARISGHRHWFYWWVSRLLLERITAFCASQNEKLETPGCKLQLEFSRRRDLKRREFTDYFTRLWSQDRDAFLNVRTIDWSVFDFKHVAFYDHEARAGLQLADVVASSFYQAVNTHPHGTCNPEFAKALKPRLYRPRHSAVDEGFTVFPYSLREIRLTDDQKEIFRFYEFPEARM